MTSPLNPACHSGKDNIMHERGDFSISPRLQILHEFLKNSGHHVASRLLCTTVKELNEFGATEKKPPVSDTIPLKDHYRKCGLAGLSWPVYMRNECACQLVKDAWGLPSRGEALHHLYVELSGAIKDNSLARLQEDVLHKVGSQYIAARPFFNSTACADACMLNSTCKYYDIH